MCISVGLILGKHCVFFPSPREGYRKNLESFRRKHGTASTTQKKGGSGKRTLSWNISGCWTSFVSSIFCCFLTVSSVYEVWCIVFILCGVVVEDSSVESAQVRDQCTVHVSRTVLQFATVGTVLCMRKSMIIYSFTVIQLYYSPFVSDYS